MAIPSSSSLHLSLHTPICVFSESFTEYAEHHTGHFKYYKIPRTQNFNSGIPSGVAWGRELSKFNETLMDYHDEFQRSRLRALQSVDESLKRREGLPTTLTSYTPLMTAITSPNTVYHLDKNVLSKKISTTL